MNIITHSAAYSLYPFSSFIKRISLAIGNTMDHQEQARAKYQSRGWEYIEELSTGHITGWFQNHGTELCSGERSVGDQWTWTIPLKPIAGINDGVTADHAMLNQWRLTYINPPTGLIELHVVDDAHTNRRLTASRLPLPLTETFACICTARV
jgi:hypothetical protein